MRILRITTSFGAQSAGYRLHQGLVHLGLDSQVLVGFKGVDDPMVHAPHSWWGLKCSGFKSMLDQIPLRFYPHRTGLPFSPSLVPDHLISKINFYQPSIVHLHWICSGFIRVETLKKIQQPIV